MMYINIKKLYSWRIRPYKIPSFFFPLLFPFFLSFLLPPFFLSSPLMVCECAPASDLLGAGPLGSRRQILALQIHSQYPIQPRNENGPGPIAALLFIVENLV